MWSEAIRQHRRRMALSQLQLADLLGVDVTSVSRWERCETVPALKIQRKLRDLIHRPHSLAVQAMIDATKLATSPATLIREPDYVHLAASLPMLRMEPKLADFIGVSVENQIDDFSRAFRDFMRRDLIAGNIASVRLIAGGITTEHYVEPAREWAVIVSMVDGVPYAHCHAGPPLSGPSLAALGGPSWQITYVDEMIAR